MIASSQNYEGLEFTRLLTDFDIEALQTSSESIYGLWPDLTLAYVNKGWSQFATANEGGEAVAEKWTLGRSILDAIPAALQPFFVSNYARCLREARPWEHRYECSTATHYRQYHMLTFPLGEAEGLLVVNSLRLEEPHSRIPNDPLEELYRNDHGILTQCCHCRRMRRDGIEDIWDWVPAWVANQPPRTSHGICKPCLGFHYPAKPRPDDDVTQPFCTGN